MAETNVDKNPGLGARYSMWVALTAFSVVVLAAVTKETQPSSSRSRTQQWALCVSGISLSLGALAWLAHAMARTRFVGTSIEGGLAFICLGFWAAGLPGIMNPRTSIALQNTGLKIPQAQYDLNANIYFFTWASFFVAAALTGSFVKEIVEARWPQRTFRRGMMWLGLCAASCVVCASGSRIFHVVNCGSATSDTDFEYACDRVQGAVSAGAVSAVISIAIILVVGSGVCSRRPLKAESLVGILMIILWCFVVAYTTFGHLAPASSVGNLYFSVWASFIFAIFVGSDAVSETHYKMFCEKSEQNAQAPAKDEPAEEKMVMEEDAVEPAKMEDVNV